MSKKSPVVLESPDVKKFPVVCFAPPLTDEALAEYSVMVDGLTRGAVKDAMAYCLRAALAWWNAPTSDAAPVDKFSLLKGGRTEVVVRPVPLTEELQARLFDDVPWDYELTGMRALFEKIQDKALRDAAHHLLWFACELERDREPLTNEVLK